MKAAIQDSEDLDTWVKYLSDMSKAVTNGLLAEHDLDLSDQAKRALYALVSEVLVEQAFASIADDLASKTVTEFLKILKDIRGDVARYGDEIDQTELPRLFTKAIKELNKEVAEGAVKFGDLAYQKGPLKVLMTAYAAGGEEALRAIRNFKGYRKEVLDLSYKQFFEKLEDIDFSKLADEDVEKLAGVYKRLENTGTESAINASQGASLELLLIAQALAEGKKVTGIQKRIPIKNSANEIIGHRESDFFFDDVFGDSKAYAPKNLLSRMKEVTKPDYNSDDKSKPSGQLFRDILDMGNNKGLKKALYFPPHAAGKEADIKKAIIDGASAPETRDKLMSLWGLPSNKNGLREFKERISEIENNIEIGVLII